MMYRDNVIYSAVDCLLTFSNVKSHSNCYINSMLKLLVEKNPNYARH